MENIILYRDMNNYLNYIQHNFSQRKLEVTEINALVSDFKDFVGILHNLQDEQIIDVLKMSLNMFHNLTNTLICFGYHETTVVIDNSLIDDNGIATIKEFSYPIISIEITNKTTSIITNPTMRQTVQGVNLSIDTNLTGIDFYYKIYSGTAYTEAKDMGMINPIFRYANFLFENRGEEANEYDVHQFQRECLPFKKVIT